MKHLNLLLILMTSAALAQNEREISNRQSTVRIMPLYQRWTIPNGAAISEVSVPIIASFPVGRNFDLALRGMQAQAGDAAKTLRGLTDTQLACRYHLEAAPLVFNLEVNFPNGRKKLSLEEFEISTLLSLPQYNFQVSNFGQGLNVAPGFTWAVPISERFVLGLGASYQYKGKFRPLAYMREDYDPGDEILLTGGFDVRLGATTTFSADLIYTAYGTDKTGDDDVFASGHQIVANTQVRQYFGYNELRLFARYRSKAKSDLVVGADLPSQPLKTLPDLTELMGHYRFRLGRKLYSSILAEGRFYEKTQAAGIKILGLGLVPEIGLTDNCNMLIRLKYQTGRMRNSPALSGWEIGFGFGINF